MLKTIVIITFVFAECAFGQHAQLGFCGSDVVGIPDFDINDYAGTWYQIERIDNEFEGACSTTEFKLADDGGLTLKVTQILGGELATVEGEAKIDSPNGSGNLEHTFHFPSGDSFVSVKSVQYVVALDSSSYALVMGCEDVDDTSRNVFAWKMSRTRSGLTPEATAAIDAVVASNPYLSSVEWSETYQSEEICAMTTVHCGEPSFAYSPDEEFCSQQ